MCGDFEGSGCVLVNGETPELEYMNIPIVRSLSPEQALVTPVDVGDIVTIVVVSPNDRMFSSILYKDGTVTDGPDYTTEDKTITITEDMLAITINEFER